MGLLNDLANISLGLITVSNVKILNNRGAYPIISSGKIVGFADADGVPIVMYKRAISRP